MHRSYLNLIMVLGFFQCSETQQPLDFNAFLSASIDLYDPDHRYFDSTFELHLQEPRTGNPGRYSKVSFGYRQPNFSLIRSRDNHESTHLISSDGAAEVLWDNGPIPHDSLITIYRLNPTRNEGYRSYYQMLCGLPMILQDPDFGELVSAQQVNSASDEQIEAVYKLKEAMFSDHWKLTWDANSKRLIRLQFYNPESPDEGEYLDLDGIHSEQGVQLIRFKHWYDQKTDEYLGSDIIVKGIRE